MKASEERKNILQVPDYELRRFGSRRSNYALFIFVLNEGKRIRNQLAKCRQQSTIIDIYIADGGSNDGSLDYSILEEHGVRGLLIKKGMGRLSAQMRMALHFGLVDGYRGFVLMDGNDKDDPGAIPLFVQRLEDGWDHIQGSRFITGGEAINTPLSRYLGVRCIHAPIVSLASGFHYTDSTNGFRAYSTRLIESPLISPFRDVFQEYELHYYLAIQAAKMGFRVCEIPVTRRYPQSGGIPTKIKGIRANVKILRTLIRACKGDFNPK